MALNFYKALQISVDLHASLLNRTLVHTGNSTDIPSVSYAYSLKKTTINTLAVYTKEKSTGCSMSCIQNVLLSTKLLSCEKNPLIPPKMKTDRFVAKVAQTCQSPTSS